MASKVKDAAIRQAPLVPCVVCRPAGGPAFSPSQCNLTSRATCWLLLGTHSSPAPVVEGLPLAHGPQTPTSVGHSPHGVSSQWFANFYF